MNISNIRFGFANNSSSSHSLIFASNELDKAASATEVCDNLGMFGRGDNFVIKSGSAKYKYLASALKENLKSNRIPDWMTDCILARYIPDTKISIDKSFISNGSTPVIPLDYNKNGIDMQFFDQFKKFILSNDIIILGGCDESVGPSDKFDYRFRTPNYDNFGFRCRWDDEYKFWSLFNDQNGTKIRFRFEDYTAESIREHGKTKTWDFMYAREAKFPITKSSTPELVDLKITNYCGANCSFCYQNSNQKGKHADKYDIYKIADAMEEMQVWEVAIGGGEPTRHPDFVNILDHLGYHKFCINFTTRSLEWLDEPLIYNTVMERCSSFAYTIKYEYEVKRLYDIMHEKGYHSKEQKCKFSVQVPLGTIEKRELQSIINVCNVLNVPLTVLGFKRTGRGIKYDIQDYSWAFEEIKKMRWIGVDEQFIKDFESEMINDKDSYIDRIFYDAPGNKFSCYIDACEMQIGRNSYSNDMISLKHKRVDNLCKSIKKEYQKF